MKKFAFLFVVISAVVIVAGCGGKKGPAKFATYDGSDDDGYRDSTIYGICTSGSAMNTLQMVTDLGDTISVSTTEAQEAGKMFGGYAVGDRMAVLVNRDTTYATMIINESALLGNWVMPNPIDGSDEVGIRIKEGGIAESILQSSIEYKSWRLFNGLLYIELEREGGVNADEHQTCEFVFLSNDSLVYKEIGEEGDTYEYGRQRIREEKHVIDLEESSFDDFVM